MNEYAWKRKNSKIPKNKEELLTILLKNRGIKDPESFFHPPHPGDFIEKSDEFTKLTKNHVTPAVSMILNAMKQNLPIVIHGDYDVDGLTAAAILWRTIHNDLGYENVHPYIPNRFDEGYGLSTESINGITKMLKDVENAKNDRPALIITVDCGITAIDTAKHAKKEGFTLIITDHHKKTEKTPKADQIIWTDKASGAGIAWILSHFLINGAESQRSDKDLYLDLAAIGTIADLQPLTGFNRSITLYGLKKLNSRPSEAIKALKQTAGINGNIGTYEIGWIIGPRLNASGRLQNAMESLRLLCSDNPRYTLKTALNLGSINQTRQEKTQADLEKAILQFKDIQNLPKFLVTASKTYHEGVIGLVAGKLVQTYYRTSIAIAIDEKSNKAKGSARSIKGISVIDTLRKFGHLFDNIGGHDMAAGFSMDPSKIPDLAASLNQLDEWDESIFNRELEIDCEIAPDLINSETLSAIELMQPFGQGNPEPMLSTHSLKIFNLSSFGLQNKHLKLYLQDKNRNNFTALAFGKGAMAFELSPEDFVDIAFSLSMNTWNGQNRLELKIKDIKKST